jgi:hypothetical protein
MIHIAHIINPVAAKEGSELALSQPFTYESMRVAVKYAETVAPQSLEVKLYSVQYEEDVRAIPTGFQQLPNLSRSIRDVVKSDSVKKFPFIGDILQALLDNTTAEYLIYTNTDIVLQPHFYVAIEGLIKKGYDAISPTRRRVARDNFGEDNHAYILAQLGKAHPGYDCFVMHRSVVEKFILSNICIGTGYVSVALIHNIIAFAQKPLISDDYFLTTHIGLEVMPPLDKVVHSATREDYERNILPKIKPLLSLFKFPYITLPLHRRVVKWVLNPNFQTSMLIELEGKSLRRQLKGLIDEFRFKALGK